MAHINRRYIDSHWLVFALKGAFAIVFGWLMLFNAGANTIGSLSIVVIFLLALSVLEFINALCRAHYRTGWTVSVLVAVFDALAAILLVTTMSCPTITESLLVVAIYTLVRGVADIIIAFRTTVDPTDRFTWIVSGICGAVMGLVILNSGAFLDTTIFVRFFGSYVLIIGVSNLIYGIHNRSQKIEDSIARSQAQKTAKKPKKSLKSPKKPKNSR